MSENKQYPITRYIKWITIVLILTAAGYSIYESYDPSNDDAETSPMLTVNVIEIKKSPSHNRKHAFLGKIEARRTSNLSFEIAGAIKEILAYEGQAVQKGQPLALLDIDHLLAKKEEITAEVERVNAFHELTRLTRNRTAEASEYRAVSETDRDQADQNFSAQKAALDGARARLSQIDIEIEKGVLITPYSGYIARRYVDEGTVVQEGSPVLEIVEIDHLEARIGVNNPQALQIGQPIELFTRLGTFAGTITSILPIRDAATRNVEIICAIKTSNAPLLPGDAASMLVEETIEGEGIWLPTSALTESSRGLWAAYLAIPQENDSYRLVRQELEILDQTTDQAFVKTPIKQGTLVVKDGMNRVFPGLSVHINKSE
jgi:RND family efflux transporter MFP subunit